MNKYLIVSIPFLLSACTPHTIGDVRELGPSKSATFDAPENYQRLYKKILEQTQQCSDGWMITAQMVTEGNLDPDNKTGTVAVSLRGGLGTNYYQVIDIKEIEANKSKVTAFYSVGSADNHVKLLKKWALDDYRKCSL